MGERDILGSTLEPPAGAGRVGAPRVPAFTVLFHPEIERVGEVAWLPELEQGRVVALSRLAPQFAPPTAAGAARPLGDRHLSRSQASLRADGGGLLLEPGGSELLVGGTPCRGPRAISSAALDRGVAIVLGGRVALLLHRTGLPGPASQRLGMEGASAALEHVRTQALRAAALRVPVLIEGESGTGKELVARAIAAAGPRASRPFVAVNLGAIPPAIAAAELLGHAQGAFTGAVGPRAGHFAAADGGTLLLDEVGAASLEVQATLLRVLETGEAQPLGIDKARKVDVRVISATDEDLAAAVGGGTFREALLHRLAAYRIRVPPLRERVDDLGRLIVHFLALEAGAGAPLATAWSALDASFMARLAELEWPGNVRQLANVARRIAVGARHGDAVGEEVLRELTLPVGSPVAAPGSTTAASSTPPPRTAMPGDAALREALRAAGWRTGAAARVLGISRTTLYALLDASPTLRKAKDLGAEELEACRRACEGDLDRMAERLEVSARGILLRLRELGLG